MDNIILNHIKKIRKELKMTVRELAEKCEMSHSSITDIENGKVIPTQISIIQLSYALNRNACEVFIFDHSAIDTYFGRNIDQD